MEDRKSIWRLGMPIVLVLLFTVACLVCMVQYKNQPSCYSKSKTIKQFKGELGNFFNLINPSGNHLDG